MSTPRHCNATRRLVGVMLLTLLLAQWTALAHAIAHAQPGAASAVAADAASPWSHQAGTASCHLVDQLLIGQLAGGEPAPIASLAPATAPVAARSRPTACGPALRAYEARGPPRP